VDGAGEAGWLERTARVSEVFLRLREFRTLKSGKIALASGSMRTYNKINKLE
jgi:hypothetical protein